MRAFVSYNRDVGEGFADVDIPTQRRIVTVNLEDLMKSECF